MHHSHPNFTHVRPASLQGIHFWRKFSSVTFINRYLDKNAGFFLLLFFFLFLFRETVTYMFNTNVASKQTLRSLCVNAYKLEVLLELLNAHISDKTVTYLLLHLQFKMAATREKAYCVKSKRKEKARGRLKSRIPFPFDNEKNEWSWGVWLNPAPQGNRSLFAVQDVGSYGRRLDLHSVRWVAFLLERCCFAGPLLPSCTWSVPRGGFTYLWPCW